MSLRIFNKFTEHRAQKSRSQILLNSLSDSLTCLPITPHRHFSQKENITD